MELAAHRALFPALGDKLYVNFGVVGAMASSTLQALVRHYEERQLAGPASPPLFAQQAQEDQALRRAFGALLEVPPDSLALVDSTCTGCSAVLLAIEWKPGDQLLLSDAEYPALALLAAELARRFGVEVVVAPLLGRTAEAESTLERALGPRTRAVLLSQVLWTSGEQLDVAAIARLLASRTPRPLFLVDGAQGAGNLHVRPAADGVDAYAFPGHKALCGPDGVGGLYVSPRVVDGLRPLTAGWRGVRVDERGAPAGFAPGARRFEGATTTFGTRPAMVEALRVADAFGSSSARAARVQALAARAFHGLREQGFATFLPAPPRSSLVCFRVAEVPCAAVAAALLRERIFVRNLPQTDVVRLSLSYLNTEEEIDRVVAALVRLRSSRGF
jgi:L-cysteine/cystine lyase